MLKINEKTTLKEIADYCAKRTTEFNKKRRTIHCSEGCIIYDCDICYYQNLAPEDWYLEDRA